MTISVKVVADSINKRGERITTLQCKYPLFIHGQIMTHRTFSRNAASNRAIPVKKLIERTRKDMAIPIEFGSNKPGMQAGKEVSPFKLKLLRALWKTAGHLACNFAYMAQALGLHKQHANRLMMPFQHIDVIITATEWDNFFSLRLHSDSQPEIQELAQKIKAVMGSSTPVLKTEGMIHLPYITEEELVKYEPLELKKISAARCARVSYLNHDKSNPDSIKDLALAKSLSESRHYSPFEHQATPIIGKDKNFIGWNQFRTELENFYND